MVLLIIPTVSQKGSVVGRGHVGRIRSRRLADPSADMLKIVPFTST